MKALNFLKTRKAAKPSGITFKLPKVCKNDSLKKLTEMANYLIQGKEMPKSWRSRSLTIYKGKRGVRSCKNCRSVKLLGHGMKVIKRICKKWLRNMMKIDKIQIGFMPRKH